MSELKQFRLPDVGEGLTEAEIVKWLVQPGDTIAINQIIVEIETAKAVVELPSPYEGVVQDLLVAEGEEADVGTPIISVQVAAEAADGTVAPAAVADGAAAPEAANAEAAAPDAAAPEAAAPEAVAPASASAKAAAATAPTGVPAPPVEVTEAPAEGAVEPGIYGSPAPKEERQAVLVGYGVKLGSTKRRARKPAAASSRGGGAAAAPATGPAAGPAAAAAAGPAAAA